MTLNNSAIKSPKPTYRLKRSSFHLVGFLLIGLAMLLAVWQLPYPIFWSLLFFCSVYAHYYLHFGSGRVTRLSQDADGTWSLDGQGGYLLLPSSSVRRYWAILHFKPRKTLAVFPDSLDKETFRRLRVALRSSEIKS